MSGIRLDSNAHKIVHMTRLLLSSIFFLVMINLCFGQTQLELNQSSHKDFQKADKELNTVYQQILKEYQSDTVFIKNFKKAQKIWIQFRDAEMNAKYPERPDGYYGSVQPMCWNNYLAGLTEERTKSLKIWLTGIEEEDACQGSVKRKN